MRKGRFHQERQPGWGVGARVGEEDHLQGVLAWLRVAESKQGEDSVHAGGWPGVGRGVGDQVGWRRGTW